MLVTSAKIEERYEAEALIAQLHTPVVDQERMTNVASATLLPSSAGPEPADADFGLAVSDDRSLDENLIAFSLERATTSGDLFLQIAEAASALGRQIDADTFTLVAAMLGDRWSADELREEVGARGRLYNGYGRPDASAQPHRAQRPAQGSRRKNRAHGAGASAGHRSELCHVRYGHNERLTERRQVVACSLFGVRGAAHRS